MLDSQPEEGAPEIDHFGPLRVVALEDFELLLARVWLVKGARLVKAVQQLDEDGGRRRIDDGRAGELQGRLDSVWAAALVSIGPSYHGSCSITTRYPTTRQCGE